MISPGSASAKLTDEGGPNVFRLWGRDDQQGAMVGDYLAEHWADKGIAILDDGTVWGAGVANAVRRSLRERGVRVAVDETLTPGEADYSPLVSKMQAAGVDVFFLGGYTPETGLIFRQAHDRGYDVQLIASSAVATEDLPLIAGPALEGSVMIATADMRTRPQAAEVVARFRAQGYEPMGNTLYVYAAVQVWAQAAEAAGSLDFDASDRRSCTAVSSTRCSARSGLTPRATSRGSSRGNGSCGRRRPPSRAARSQDRRRWWARISRPHAAACRLSRNTTVGRGRAATAASAPASALACRTCRRVDFGQRFWNARCRDSWRRAPARDGSKGACLELVASRTHARLSSDRGCRGRGRRRSTGGRRLPRAPAAGSRRCTRTRLRRSGRCPPDRADRARWHRQGAPPSARPRAR